MSAESAETGMVSAAASGYGEDDATVRPLMRAVSHHSMTGCPVKVGTSPSSLGCEDP
jgi:hypothetical protein